MVTQGVVSPETDKLQYRELQLDNGLRVLLVSDGTSEKAAAAVNVRQHQLIPVRRVAIHHTSTSIIRSACLPCALQTQVSLAASTCFCRCFCYFSASSGRYDTRVCPARNATASIRELVRLASLESQTIHNQKANSPALRLMCCRGSSDSGVCPRRPLNVGARGGQLCASIDRSHFRGDVQVRVGSLSDPEEFLGLAHFLEHMLFYASERYPVEDEYMKFVVSLS